jgi:GT2 family glycosyltransferase
VRNQPLPFVTIGIACFNAEKTIERALRSLQRQTWPNLEILVVDDGSSDGSVLRVLRAGREDPRVRLVRHESNAGTAAARNSVLAAARGTLLGFLDADDEAMPGRVSEQVAAIETYEADNGVDLVACYCSRLVVGPDGVTHTARAIGSGPDKAPSGARASLHILAGRSEPGYTFGRTGTGTVLARATTFEVVGSFDPAFLRLEDQDWAIRLAQRGGHFIGCVNPLIRQHVTTGAHKADRKPLVYGLMLCRKHRGHLRDHGLYWTALAHTHLTYNNWMGRRTRFRFWMGVLLCLQPARTWRHVRRHKLKQGHE